MVNVFDEFRKEHKPDPLNKEGYVWINMLIKYDLDGKATVIRSFTRPARESMIKTIKKEDKKFDKIEIETESDSKDLFEV
jgi:hypothetical protein